jgi:hypothetical protein
MDKVGSNTSQKGYGNECIPQLKSSKKDKHFTALGLILLAHQ